MQDASPPAEFAGLYIHIRILLGMIVGLGLTHVLRHVARLIEQPGARRIYWVHLLWVAFVFVYLLHFWWWQFRLSHQAQWDFNLYLFVTLYALLLYLLCALVFPESLDGYRGYEDYYYSRRRWFFGALVLVFAVDLADTAFKGAGYFRQLGPEYPLRNGLYIVAGIAAMATRNRFYHGAWAIAALAYELSWIVRYYERI